jgi:acyl-CoA thioesterase I
MKYFVLLLFVFVSFMIHAQQKIKVACVGDSITEGGDLDNEKRYPTQLQLMVGEEYDVKNYGSGGSTMLRKGDFSYWQEKNYKEVLAWNPDVIIIKLGTNDSKPQNWIYGEEFEGDYRAFVQSFKKLTGPHKIFLCTPVPVFKDLAGIEAGIVKDEIVALVKNVALAEKVSLIDLHTSFANKPELFPDGVHPNAEGAKLIAENVFRAIKP